MIKYVFFILTSINEKLLKVTYETVLHQKNHNIDYNIIIVVNSINPNYYHDVCQEFKNIDVEIIETKSNGKPGAGHNSLIRLFHTKKQYDYMMMIDGDDFIYPYTLQRIQECFKKQQNIDMLVLKSTDKLKYINQNDTDLFNIYLNHNFMIESKIYVDYKLYPWNNQHMNLSNMYTNSLCTPLRLFLLSRNIFNFITEPLFHEECTLYDDYLLFLYFIQLSQNKNINTFIIPGKYIYIYNSINNNSQTHNTTNNDLIHYNKLKDKFKTSCDFLGPNWDLTLLPTLYINHQHNIKYNYKIDTQQKNINMNINIQTLYDDPNYLYIKKFTNELITKIIDSYYKIINQKFQQSDFKSCLHYCDFYNQYNIIHPYISYIYIYSYHQLNLTSFQNNHISILKKNITIAKPFLQLYNIQSLKYYCDFIISQ